MYKFLNKLKLRILFFIHMLPNYAEVLTGKRELKNIVNRVSASDTELYLTYSYGKTGSSSVFSMLNAQFSAVFHCHYLSDEQFTMSEILVSNNCLSHDAIAQKIFSNARYHLYRTIVWRFLQEEKKIKLIITLREPFSYLRSNYFQNIRIFSDLCRVEYGEVNAERFSNYFQKSINICDRDICLLKTRSTMVTYINNHSVHIGARYMAYMIYSYIYFFEEEVFSIFGGGYDAIGFKDGYWFFNEGNISAVIVKLENFSSVLNSALKDITKSKVDVSLANKNTAATKTNYDYYSYLKENTKIPKSIQNILKRSSSYKFFYGSG